ncbi:MAG: hypothetical protein COZ98_06020 [Candidatus Omnitrophica bacterium CG_4_8_14_3_um_filter_43_15]|nr:MAG: hypothetical protein AUJ89_06130 [Candidatus Omnitrophica bacterium CG1_02_43_210]PIV11500.1 MAG: hypothetical protein COS48_05615 [Candidatus Omnitrophica bacterium CG03_land_8_20_14_0_80_43_22]PIW79737.1 MAG: hypothetical protein COZ98_06020 [Candidatus Omnitrophica bacterium CG_4_8_14_3_um_filter_43_15]PIY84475.1 MAG: hypothetical protein COY77_02260 [Candidatus Omnitrophica bacterium CG_4_10_14_0_8_um_filter_43_18]PJC45974.1 MAG: hypothetical protein CO036_05270 [Candidatus Omnitrop
MKKTIQIFSIVLCLGFICLPVIAEEPAQEKQEYSEARVFNNNGVDFVASKKYTDAIKEFKKALDIDKSFQAARYNLALAYYNSGKTKDAISELKYLTNSSYYFVNAHYNLGTIYLREGMLDEATEQLNIVIELEPSHAEAYFNLGFIYFKKDLLDDALTYYKEGVEIRPDSVKGRMSLAFIYEKKNMFKEAADEYMKALEFNPDNQDAKQALGGVQAISRIREYLKSDSKDAWAYVYLGHIYYARGMYKEAVDNYNKALQIDPANATAKTSSEKTVVMMLEA